MSAISPTQLQNPLQNNLQFVFLGAPGAGKGTQAKILCAQLGLVHISTGDMLRASVASGSELGLRVKSIIDSGQLVPDATIVEIIKARTAETDCHAGYVLDGFPRTVAQAEALTKMLEDSGQRLTAVVLFELSEAEVMKRLASRRSAEARVDDAEAVQKERMRVYYAQTAPLIDYYKAQGMLTTVDASGSLDDVTANLISALGLVSS